jgi:hypothetical protein
MPEELVVAFFRVEVFRFTLTDSDQICNQSQTVCVTAKPPYPTPYIVTLDEATSTTQM